eukprot:scaffold121408_cov30-Tisochrysis_lutea.AAC.19
MCSVSFVRSVLTSLRAKSAMSWPRLPLLLAVSPWCVQSPCAIHASRARDAMELIRSSTPLATCNLQLSLGQHGGAPRALTLKFKVHPLQGHEPSSLPNRLLCSAWSRPRHAGLSRDPDGREAGTGPLVRRDGLPVPATETEREEKPPTTGEERERERKNGG